MILTNVYANSSKSHVNGKIEHILQPSSTTGVALIDPTVFRGNRWLQWEYKDGLIRLQEVWLTSSLTNSTLYINIGDATIVSININTTVHGRQEQKVMTAKLHVITTTGTLYSINLYSRSFQVSLLEFLVLSKEGNVVNISKSPVLMKQIHTLSTRSRLTDDTSALVFSQSTALGGLPEDRRILCVSWVSDCSFVAGLSQGDLLHTHIYWARDGAVRTSGIFLKEKALLQVLWSEIVGDYANHLRDALAVASVCVRSQREQQGQGDALLGVAVNRSGVLRTWDVGGRRMLDQCNVFDWMPPLAGMDGVGEDLDRVNESTGRFLNDCQVRVLLDSQPSKLKFAHLVAAVAVLVEGVADSYGASAVAGEVSSEAKLGDGGYLLSGGDMHWKVFLLSRRCTVVGPSGLMADAGCKWRPFAKPLVFPAKTLIGPSSLMQVQASLTDIQLALDDGGRRLVVYTSWQTTIEEPSVVPGPEGLSVDGTSLGSQRSHHLLCRAELDLVSFRGSDYENNVPSERLNPVKMRLVSQPTSHSQGVDAGVDASRDTDLVVQSLLRQRWVPSVPGSAVEDSLLGFSPLGKVSLDQAPLVIKRTLLHRAFASRRFPFSVLVAATRTLVSSYSPDATKTQAINSRIRDMEEREGDEEASRGLVLLVLETCELISQGRTEEFFRSQEATPMLHVTHLHAVTTRQQRERERTIFQLSTLQQLLTHFLGLAESLLQRSLQCNGGSLVLLPLAPDPAMSAISGSEVECVAVRRGGSFSLCVKRKESGAVPSRGSVQQETAETLLMMVEHHTKTGARCTSFTSRNAFQQSFLEIDTMAALLLQDTTEVDAEGTTWVKALYAALAIKGFSEGSLVPLLDSLPEVIEGAMGELTGAGGRRPSFLEIMLGGAQTDTASEDLATLIETHLQQQLKNSISTTNATSSTPEPEGDPCEWRGEVGVQALTSLLSVAVRAQLQRSHLVLLLFSLVLERGQGRVPGTLIHAVELHFPQAVLNFWHSQLLLHLDSLRPSNTQEMRRRVGLSNFCPLSGLVTHLPRVSHKGHLRPVNIHVDFSCSVLENFVSFALDHLGVMREAVAAAESSVENSLRAQRPTYHELLTCTLSSLRSYLVPSVCGLFSSYLFLAGQYTSLQKWSSLLLLRSSSTATISESVLRALSSGAIDKRKGERVSDSGDLSLTPDLLQVLRDLREWRTCVMKGTASLYETVRVTLLHSPSDLSVLPDALQNRLDASAQELLDAAQLLELDGGGGMDECGRPGSVRGDQEAVTMEHEEAVFSPAEICDSLLDYFAQLSTQLRANGRATGLTELQSVELLEGLAILCDVLQRLTLNRQLLAAWMSELVIGGAPANALEAGDSFEVKCFQVLTHSCLHNTSLLRQLVKIAFLAETQEAMHRARPCFPGLCGVDLALNGAQLLVQSVDNCLSATGGVSGPRPLETSLLAELHSAWSRIFELSLLRRDANPQVSGQFRVDALSTALHAVQQLAELETSLGEDFSQGADAKSGLEGTDPLSWRGCLRALVGTACDCGELEWLCSIVDPALQLNGTVLTNSFLIHEVVSALEYFLNCCDLARVLQRPSRGPNPCLPPTSTRLYYGSDQFQPHTNYFECLLAFHCTRGNFQEASRVAYLMAQQLQLYPVSTIDSLALHYQIGSLSVSAVCLSMLGEDRSFFLLRRPNLTLSSEADARAGKRDLDLAGAVGRSSKKRVIGFITSSTPASYPSASAGTAVMVDVDLAEESKGLSEVDAHFTRLGVRQPQPPSSEHQSAVEYMDLRELEVLFNVRQGLQELLQCSEETRRCSPNDIFSAGQSVERMVLLLAHCGRFCRAVSLAAQCDRLLTHHSDCRPNVLIQVGGLSLEYPDCRASPLAAATSGAQGEGKMLDLPIMALARLCAYTDDASSGEALEEAALDVGHHTLLSLPCHSVLKTVVGPYQEDASHFLWSLMFDVGQGDDRLLLLALWSALSYHPSLSLPVAALRSHCRDQIALLRLLACFPPQLSTACRLAYHMVETLDEGHQLSKQGMAVRPFLLAVQRLRWIAGCEFRRDGAEWALRRTAAGPEGTDEGM